MNLRAAATTLIACALTGMLMPSAAQAANTTCANADFLFLNERASYDIGAAGNLFFKTRVVAGRSYAVMAWGPSQDSGEGGVSLAVDLYSDSACLVSMPGVDRTDNEPFLFDIDGHSGDHDNVIPQSSGPMYIRVNNGVAFSYKVHVAVVETTVFSAWWFAGGTNQAYVEVRNTMNSPAAAVLTLYRSDGSVCATSSQVLAGDGNAAINVGALGTCAAATSGSAQLAFAGTPGGVVANITTIDVVNGTSFDSPFVARMVWGTFNR